MHHPSEQRNTRGASIIVLSLFFMLLLSLLATTLYKVIPIELHEARRSHTDLQGHYVARSGIQQTMTWLQSQMKSFDDTQDERELPDFNSGSLGAPTFPNIESYEARCEAYRPFASGDWRYTVDIEPLQDSIGLKHGFEPRFYSVRSTSYFKNRPVRSIDVLLKQRTFASFAFYSEQTDSNSQFVIDGQTRIQGPVHTNDFWRFKAETGLWDDETATPYFMDVVSHAGIDPNAPAFGDGNSWLGGDLNAPYDENGPLAGRYEKVFAGGRNDLRVKNSIDLPSSTDAILEDVWAAGVDKLPKTPGVHLSSDSSNTLNGGLYVKNDIDRVRMELTRYGNQKMRFVDDGVKVGKKTIKATRRVPDKSAGKKTVTKTRCVKWGPPKGSGGSGSGVNGGSLNNVCLEKQSYQAQVWKKYDKVEYDKTVSVKQDHMWEVIEASESPEDYTYFDTNGDRQTVTIQKGQTLLAFSEGDNFGKSSGMKTQDVKLYNGFINGTMYFDGNIGNENNREEGLWGIVKGTPEYDTINRKMVEDSAGNVQYINKTVVTSLNRSVNLGGDLLQFNQQKFLAEGGASGNHAGVRNWQKVALDPSLGELSPTNDHVLGIISRDIWLKGPKNRNSRNGNDGYNDIYAVILAGKTEKDRNGDILKNVDGEPITSGGFGTWRQDRDQLRDKLGKVRVFGGVIQGTTGANHNDRSRDTHYWTTDGVGYEVDLTYDIEATRQKYFPTFPEFRILRWLERNAKG